MSYLFILRMSHPSPHLSIVLCQTAFTLTFLLVFLPSPLFIIHCIYSFFFLFPQPLILLSSFWKLQAWDRVDLSRFLALHIGALYIQVDSNQSPKLLSMLCEMLW